MNTSSGVFGVPNFPKNLVSHLQKLIKIVHKSDNPDIKSIANFDEWTPKKNQFRQSFKKNHQFRYRQKINK